MNYKKMYSGFADTLPRATALGSILLLNAVSGFAAGSGRDIDPVIASPGNYRVVLENEHVRVVEYKVNPGERDNWHTHPPKVAYVVTPGRLRITTGTGESFEVEEAAGSARWLGAVGKHRGENIGNTQVHIVFVEIKGLPGDGNDLEQFLHDEPDLGKR